MPDVPALAELAHRLCTVRGVLGVTLGGSRARGEHLSGSDFDLGLYYRQSLDVDGLASLADEVAAPGFAVVPPGSWGHWVDGGAWLQIGGASVDWIYRDLERVRECWDDAQQGRYRFHFQVGHPLGFPDFVYAAEVALGVVLADPTGALRRLQNEMADYPPALSTALVDDWLRRSSCCLRHAKRYHETPPSSSPAAFSG